MKNPIIEGWYADPESRVYDGRLYIYLTNSLPFEEQVNISLATSDDLENFSLCENIVDMSTFPDAKYAIWAPSAVEKGGKYYLIFAANNIMSESERGGLYLGVSDRPDGPFRNVFQDRRALIGRIYNNAQPIDAHFFKDDDGEIYLYYGGWGHMMVCLMNEDMNGFKHFDGAQYDGIAKDITPSDYVEAPCVVKMNGEYHLMYSSGNWMDGTYSVKAAKASAPTDKFEYYRDILSASEIADGPGHNSEFCFGGEQYVAYHRRIVGDKNPHHRQLCIDKLGFENGGLAPVTMTK